MSPASGLVYDALIISYELIVCCVLVAEERFGKIGVELCVVNVELLCNLEIVRVQHIHCNIELYRIAVVFLLAKKI